MIQFQEVLFNDLPDADAAAATETEAGSSSWLRVGEAVEVLMTDSELYGSRYAARVLALEEGRSRAHPNPTPHLNPTPNFNPTPHLNPNPPSSQVDTPHLTLNPPSSQVDTPHLTPNPPSGQVNLARSSSSTSSSRTRRARCPSGSGRPPLPYARRRPPRTGPGQLTC